MEDATVTEPPSSDGSSSTSSAFIDRMNHRMNMIPNILQPLGAVVVEQQEVAIQSDLSVQAAEDDPEDDASVLAAVAAIIDDGAAGVVDKVLGQETEELQLQLVQQHP
jgi:predicted regulator of Ras-like GTPase activity (Roadblock/LC7/MglB family)